MEPNSLNSCKVERLVIPENRIRRDITDESVRELANDIEKNGLLHPIVARRSKEDVEATEPHHLDLILVAGERRLTAIKLLYKEDRSFICNTRWFTPQRNHVPFVYLAALSESEALEVELHENLMRTDLDWKVVTAARAKLHELRTAEAADEGRKWGIADTARELADSAKMMSHPSAVAAVKTATIVEPFLDDPILKNIKSEKDAYKVIMRQYEGEFIEALKSREPEEDSRTSSLVFINNDFREADIPNDAFDLIIADPPYGVGADGFGDASKRVHEYMDSKDVALAVAQSIFTQGYNWTRPDAQLFMFCDVDLFGALKKSAESSGWKPFRTPIIWSSGNAGHIPWGTSSFRRSYELILYATKGNAQLLRLHQDIVSVGRERGEAADFAHGARKPPELYAYLMSLACLPDSYIIDPCCGSGPIFPAAKKERMIAWGVEKDPEIAKSALVELERSR